MYNLHLKYLSTMADMALTYSQAYTEAMSANLEAAAKATTGQDAGEPSKNANSKLGYFALPEMPQPGQSWYRAPQENPVLAFWDDMLKPWRTYATNGWSGVPTYMPVQAHENMQAVFAFAPWLQQWSDLLAHAASAMPAPTNLQAEFGAAANGSQHASNSAIPVAQAKIRFPDDTEVTISIPYLPVTFAGAPFLNKPRS